MKKKYSFCGSVSSYQGLALHRRPVVQAVALALAIQAASANAATITVDSIVDDSSNCSLRNAIESANTNSSVGTCAAGDNSGTDTIDLSAISGQTITLDGSSLVVNSAITIQGAGVTVDADLRSRLWTVYEEFTDLTIDTMSLTGASPDSSAGGAILIFGESTLTLINSTLSNNTTAIDGAIRVNSARVNLINSTISGNQSAVGAGIYLDADSTATLVNSTLSGNSASDKGGGIYAWNSHVEITNSIIANSGGYDCWNGGNSTFTLRAANLIETNYNCQFSGQTPIEGIDPELGNLADNGGPTQTHMPDPGSPVIDAGIFTGIDVQDFDQRGPGYPRIASFGQDLGSVEVESLNPPQSGPNFVVTTTDDRVTGGVCEVIPGHCSLRAAINAADSNADASIITFDGALFSPTPPTIKIKGSWIPTITSEITIQGVGVTVAAEDPIRLFRTTGSAAHLSLDNITLTGASSASYGSALFAYDGSTISLSNSTLTGNSASVGGGIAAVKNAFLLVSDSTLSGNTSGSSGGAVYASRGSNITLTNSTISGNSSAFGGGIAADGPGLASSGSVALTLINNTISDNSASASGGGIWGRNAVVSLTNNIIANSVNGDCKDFAGSTFTTIGANLVEDNDDCTFTGPAPINADPILAPLADNGGQTKTHRLLAGSPAIDAGVNNALPGGLIYDQRGAGFDRIIDGTVDLGSFEYVTLPPLIFTDSFEQ